MKRTPLSDLMVQPYPPGMSTPRRLVHEAWDHLWPWSSEGWHARRSLILVSLVLGLIATLAWGAAAMGSLSRGGLIAWWFGWSLFEVGVRRQCKPYVKEGPWWGAVWRQASWMDLLCYVMFKNLLLGSGLYLALNALGLLAD